jgi:predicted  nucleic acid-binding Zn-ribbon protein
MPTSAKATSKATKQTIEELRQRYQDLNTKKIQAETNLQNAKDALKKLQDEARKKFGTDDVAALKDKLREMEKANEKARSEYQQSLDTIEAALEKVESDLDAVQGAPDSAAGDAVRQG